MPETRVPSPNGETTATATGGKTEVDIVVEKEATLGRRKWWIAGARKPVAEQEFKLSLRDVNPLRPALAVLKEPVNLLTVLASGESRIVSSFSSFVRISRLTELSLPFSFCRNPFRRPIRHFFHRGGHCECHPLKHSLYLCLTFASSFPQFAAAP